MTRMRADLLLVDRGLASSRAKARAAIEAGLVRAGGQLVDKPGTLLPLDCVLEAQPAFAWVSRAGLKLEHALAAFDVACAGRTCLDLGASTGGFVDVLLAHGAKSVVAVDVGHGQLHPKLASDPRVLSLERTDARSLTEDLLPHAPQLITSDLSFIGLGKVLPHVLPLAAPEAEAIVLIKPQFEAGPQRVGKGGLVDPVVAEQVRDEVAHQLDGLAGFALAGLIDSPIRGSDGNREFLMHLKREASGRSYSSSGTP